MIIYSDDEEEDELSDAETSSTAGEGLDQPPTNLPESVDIEEEDTEPENDEDECHETVDALGGADVFGDVPIEQDVIPPVTEDQEEEIIREGSLMVEELSPEEEDIKPPASVASSAGSESSVDLADVAFNFTPEEMRAIRRKRKEERREAKKNQLLMRKRRERELALAKKDRFFDKSRIIPNEIYFGDIVVPLHVLHTYGQQEGQISSKGASKQTHNQQTSHKMHGTSSRSVNVLRKSADGTNSRIEMYKRYLKVAGIRQRHYKSLIKRCVDDMQVISVMLKILRDHGLVGDPTIAKCRELKRARDDDVSDDGEGLDTSAIINTDGRLLRNGKKVRQDTESHYQHSEVSPPIVLEERGPQLASQDPPLDDSGPKMGDAISRPEEVIPPSATVDVVEVSSAEKTE